MKSRKMRLVRHVASMAGGWRRLFNEECHNLYTSLNIIRVMESRKMRLAGHVCA